MNNNGENSQMSTKSVSVENNNKESSVDKYKEKAKSFTGKIVNKISNISSIRRIEITIDKSSNVKFITFGLFALIGFIAVIYAILVVVVAADTAIQSANVFFVVTIISISTLFGPFIYKIFLSK
jgi:hypothetical protein